MLVAQPKEEENKPNWNSISRGTLGFLVQEHTHHILKTTARTRNTVSENTYQGSGSTQRSRHINTSLILGIHREGRTIGVMPNDNYSKPTQTIRNTFSSRHAGSKQHNCRERDIDSTVHDSNPGLAIITVIPPPRRCCGCPVHRIVYGRLILR